MNQKFALEIRSGQRFAFGANWTRFLNLVDEARIAKAEESLQSMLGMRTLNGCRFLDVGSGSGLFSLAARRLGAAVCSFDYDPRSVACTSELRRRYLKEDPYWTVQAGSILDDEFVSRLGAADVVYSWGVLHHTGNLRKAMHNVAGLVADGGTLFIALYNDQGWLSRYWARVKSIYNSSAVGKIGVIALHAPYLIGGQLVSRTLSNRLSTKRGMSLWYDMYDWLGGFPFEVAKPGDVLSFFRDHGFGLERLVTCAGRMGCNEFVFRRTPSAAAHSTSKSPTLA